MKFKIIFTLLACLIAFSGFAQNTLESGTIKMEITDVSSDNEQVAAGLDMLRGTETTYYFNEELSMVNANMMGGMMEMVSLVDNKTEDLTFTMNMMGQKMLVRSTKAERDALEAKNGKSKASSEDFEITYDKEDTKEILGYNCFKANVSHTDEEFSFVLYLTEEIKASNKMIQGMEAVNIEGFPLQYMMDMKEMQMTYTATEVSNDLDTEVFNIETEGYKEMTFEEFMNNMGAMGGGMGF